MDLVAAVVADEQSLVARAGTRSVMFTLVGTSAFSNLPCGVG